MDPRTLHERLRGAQELALIDVREEGVFGQAHILRAVNVPLSVLELRFRDLVPRKTVPVVLCDGGDDGLADRAAKRLSAMGYRDVTVLTGGAAGWGAAGFELFSGINVPSKAFGEVIEHRYQTPRLGASEVDAALRSDKRVVILDSRPFEEYAVMNIPGGIDMPGAELVHRVKTVVDDDEALVVVNCAGRTRSIIGAQSLINAGLENRVVALKDGTMGWHLAGLILERGADRRGQDRAVDAAAAGWGKDAAERVARRFGVETIAPAIMERWRAEADRRTLYLLDVRQPVEFEAGHLPGSRNAQGGQLVQATDRYVGTQNARIVLIDDTGTRALMTASWLVQMGWKDVAVLEGGLGQGPLETGPVAAPVPELEGVRTETVGPAAVSEIQGAAVVDLASSLAHRSGHVPGAWWAIRARLAAEAGNLPGDGPLVLTCPDGRLATLAAADLQEASDRPVLVLAGGTGAWVGAGLPLETGIDRTLSAVEDAYYRPYDRTEGVEEAMNAYLSWEVGLLHQIERDGTLAFPAFPA